MACKPQSREIRVQGFVGLYWGYIGIMEKKMETTVEALGFSDLLRALILGLHRDNGKETGSYCLGFRV